MPNNMENLKTIFMNKEYTNEVRSLQQELE